MAQITRHNPAAVHAPSSGYSMGLELGQHRRLLFISGQVPERSDGSVPEGFEAQCEQAWRNVIEVLATAGLGVEHLVKINTFLTDKSQVVPNRAVRRRMLGVANHPAEDLRCRGHRPERGEGIRRAAQVSRSAGGEGRPES